jgi:argininosuccinate lyase
MTSTGRLHGGLGLRTQQIVFGGRSAAELVDELTLITEIDLAHVVMLLEQDLIDQLSAASLLRAITALRDADFDQLQDLPRPRGVYLMYEHYLIQRLGPQIGGRLHTGRSRNDLGATVTAMRLRSWLLDFLGEAVRLQAVLLSRARAHRDTIMPIYTHFQAAMPITYGHYLVGVGLALGRDVVAARQACDGLSRCPLGAGSVAGCDLPIDPARTAALLGFSAPPVHAVDAVASRDVLLRVLAAVTGISVTLSRLATDLQLWSTTEFGFVEFPERLVGSSSAMPQKRNAFLLEHVKATAGTAIGAWTAAACAMKSTPFTNTIEVGTEAVRSAWSGLHAVADAVLLAQVLASGATPVPARMTRRAEDSFVTATALANRLVRDGVPFRTAHHAVGAAVRRAVERGQPTIACREVPDGATVDLADGLSLGDVVTALDRGGGPGAFDDGFAPAHQAWSDQQSWLRDQRDRLRRASRELIEAVGRVLMRGG